jgi:hypothetical protein
MNSCGGRASTHKSRAYSGRQRTIPEGWHPIATSPKDGAKIILSGVEWGTPTVKCFVVMDGLLMENGVGTLTRTSGWTN